MRPVLLALILLLATPAAFAATKTDTITLAAGASETVSVTLAQGQRVRWEYGVSDPRFFEAFLTIRGGPVDNATTVFSPARDNSRDGTFEAPVSGAYRFTFENPNTRTIVLNYRIEHAVPGELPGPGLTGVLVVLLAGALLFTFGRRR